MEKQDENFRKDLEYMLRLLKRVEYLENKAKDQLEQIDKLQTENNRLKYEYADSKRNRDKALPYKWSLDGIRMRQMCPKCDANITNWQRYCEHCGQKIKQGNPLPEMRVEDESR